MSIDNIDVGQELLNVPMGEMIRSMALGIAEAQWELDKAGMTVAELMSGQRLLRDLDTGRLLNKTGDYVGEAQAEVVDSRVYFGFTYEEDKDGTVTRTPQKLSMMELGFVPTFYQFVDTIIEVRIAITMSRETESTQKSTTQTTEKTQKNTAEDSSRSTYGWWSSSSSHTRKKSTGSQTKALASSVDASYSNKFSYSAEGSSLLRTKLVPVPPPAILDERIRQVMEQEERYKRLNEGKKKRKTQDD